MDGPNRSMVSPVERLPPEILHKILSNVEDVASLRSAALTCPVIYTAFMGDEKAISATVLSRLIHPTMLPDAVARLDSVAINPLQYEKVHDFVLEYYGVEDIFNKERPLSLASALSIFRFHTLSQWFTEDFVSSTTQYVPDASQSPTRRAISTTETRRIQRAFYRYETFCNLFYKDAGDDGWFEQSEEWKSQREQDDFLSKFSPWENEQLACVHAYLVEKLRPIFDDVAQHDIIWAECDVHWIGAGTWLEHFQKILSYGLSWVKKIIHHTEYETRVKLLDPWPESRRDFLEASFRRINGKRSTRLPRCEGVLKDADDNEDDTYNNHRYWNIRLERCTPEQEQVYISAPFFADPDPGPETIWRWAHSHSDPQNFVSSYNKSHIRWGYVFWDNDRLQNMETWQFQYSKDHRSERFENHYRRTEEEERAQKAAMNASIEARKRIYQKGGEGWWAEGDESRIVWGGRKERPDPKLKNSPNCSWKPKITGRTTETSALEWSLVWTQDWTNGTRRANGWSF